MPIPVPSVRDTECLRQFLPSRSFQSIPGRQVYVTCIDKISDVLGQSPVPGVTRAHSRVLLLGQEVRKGLWKGFFCLAHSRCLGLCENLISLCMYQYKSLLWCLDLYKDTIGVSSQSDYYPRQGASGWPVTWVPIEFKVCDLPYLTQDQEIEQGVVRMSRN